LRRRSPDREEDERGRGEAPEGAPGQAKLGARSKRQAVRGKRAPLQARHHRHADDYSHERQGRVDPPSPRAPLAGLLLITSGKLDDRVQGLGGHQGHREEEKEAPSGAPAVGADEDDLRPPHVRHARIPEDSP